MTEWEPLSAIPADCHPSQITILPTFRHSIVTIVSARADSVIKDFFTSRPMPTRMQPLESLAEFPQWMRIPRLAETPSFQSKGSSLLNFGDLEFSTVYRPQGTAFDRFSKVLQITLPQKQRRPKIAVSVKMSRINTSTIILRFRQPKRFYLVDVCVAPVALLGLAIPGFGQAYCKLDKRSLACAISRHVAEHCEK